MSREEALLSLLKFESPLYIIKNELSKYPWDSDKEYVVVNNEIMIHVLKKFLHNEISTEQLEEWANIIECREDIGFEKEQQLQVIVEIANQSLYEIVTKRRIEDIMVSLSRLA